MDSVENTTHYLTGHLQNATLMGILPVVTV